MGSSATHKKSTAVARRLNCGRARADAETMRNQERTITLLSSERDGLRPRTRSARPTHKFNLRSTPILDFRRPAGDCQTETQDESTIDHPRRPIDSRRRRDRQDHPRRRAAERARAQSHHRRLGSAGGPLRVRRQPAGSNRVSSHSQARDRTSMQQKRRAHSSPTQTGTSAAAPSSRLTQSSPRLTAAAEATTSSPADTTTATATVRS